MLSPQQCAEQKGFLGITLGWLLQSQMVKPCKTQCSAWCDVPQSFIWDAFFFIACKLRWGCLCLMDQEKNNVLFPIIIIIYVLYRWKDCTVTALSIFYFGRPCSCQVHPQSDILLWSGDNLVLSSWSFAWSYRLLFWSRYLVLTNAKASGVSWEK